MHQLALLSSGSITDSKFNSDNLLTAFSELIEDNSIVNSVVSTLELMDIAEQEIADFQKCYPEYKDEIWNAFSHLCWHFGSDVNEKIYRHHARELLQRIVDGKDLNPGTKAEILNLILDCSISQPLQIRVTALAEQIFKEIFGNVFDSVEQAPFISEPWENSSLEILSELRQKLSRKRD